MDLPGLAANWMRNRPRRLREPQPAPACDSSGDPVGFRRPRPPAQPVQV